MPTDPLSPDSSSSDSLRTRFSPFLSLLPSNSLPSGSSPFDSLLSERALEESVEVDVWARAVVEDEVEA